MRVNGKHFLSTEIFKHLDKSNISGSVKCEILCWFTLLEVPGDPSKVLVGPDPVPGNQQQIQPQPIYLYYHIRKYKNYAHLRLTWTNGPKQYITER